MKQALVFGFMLGLITGMGFMSMLTLALEWLQ